MTEHGKNRAFEDAHAAPTVNAPWVLKSFRRGERLGLLLLAGCFFWAAGIAGCQKKKEAPSAEPEKQANVLFIIIDTFRADRAGWLGYERETTPHLTKLSENSFVFENAYATAPWTMPSVASMFTGYHPSALGVRRRGIRIPEEVATLPELLSENGFLTVGIVSHLFVAAKFGFGRGFDYFDSKESRGHDYFSSPGVTARASVALRELSKKDAPFFLFAHYFDPHYNYFEHEGFEYSKDYDGRLQPGMNYMQMRHLFRSGAADRSDRQFLNDEYDSELAYTDHHVGFLLEQLERRGLYDDTLIVVAGDHGEELADYPDGWIGHTRKLTNEVIKVPLLIKAPGQDAKKRISTPVSLVDLASTITSAAGLAETAAELPGASLLAKKPKRPRARPVFAETLRHAKLQAVVTPEWKLVHNLRHPGQARLYHLREDPGARVNVAGAHPKILKNLQAARMGWKKKQTQNRRRIGPGGRPAQLLPREVKLLEELGYISQNEPDSSGGSGSGASSN